MPALADVARKKLKELERAGRRRALVSSERTLDMCVLRKGRHLVSFSCNDFLGLSQHPLVKVAAVDALRQYGAGAGASRLVTGNHILYTALEAALAKRHKAEAALVFGSGYMANLGILPALMGKGDLILADRLAHACLLDGAQLSGAKLLRFSHNDAADCARILAAQRKEFRNAIIVTDAIFSMDGDIAPLAKLREAAKTHDAWLMADGAHQLTPLPVPVDMYVGTLSKALGSYGGYVCAQTDIIDYLATAARTLMFSTGLPPASLASALAALRVIADNPELPEKPLAKARLFTSVMGLPPAQSQIVPLMVGTEEKAIKAAAALEEAGYLAVAIRPPTVPQGTSRLRFAFSALHRDEDVLKLAAAMKMHKLL